MPEISVVVVTYNSGAVVADCLRSLPAAMAGRSHEVLVVDNASADDTREVVGRTAPAATVLAMGSNAGYAAAVNAGARHALGGAVLVLNPDIRLAPGALPPLLEALHTPGVGIAVPRLCDDDGRTRLSLRREPTLARAVGQAVLGVRAARWPALSELVGDPRAYRRPGRADWATGAAMLLSRACLDRVGEWDESFFLYSEETDFALRARDAGLALHYVPEAVAVHLGGESSTSPALWSMLTANRVRLYRRRHGMPATAAFTAVVAAGELVRAARGSATSRAAVLALATGRVPLRPPAARPARPSSVAGPLPRLPVPPRAAVPPPSAAHPHPGPGAAAADPPYVFFSGLDWWQHSHAHADFQLATRVAAGRDVLFVNSIGMRMPLPGRSTTPLRRVVRKARSVARRRRQPLPDVPRLHVLTPLVVPAYGSPAGRAVNAWLVRQQVLRAQREVGIERPVYVVTIPTAEQVVRPLPRTALVYNRSDKHSAFAEADAAVIGAYERRLLAAADTVLYVSRSLLEEERHLTGPRAAYLGHGVDLDHFGPGPAGGGQVGPGQLGPGQVGPGGDGQEPADLAGVPRPRAGFVGRLRAHTVDLDLLAALADARPDVALVLVGAADTPLDELLRRPNVHWLGAKPYEQVPAYARGLDVALMPWLRNDWIASCNPIKLREYLALGLPVVSTDYPEVHRDAAVVAVAGSPAEFVALVGHALVGPADGDRATAAAARRAWVARDSWDARAADLLRLAERTAVKTLRHSETQELPPQRLAPAYADAATGGPAHRSAGPWRNGARTASAGGTGS